MIKSCPIKKNEAKCLLRAYSKHILGLFQLLIPLQHVLLLLASGTIGNSAIDKKRLLIFMCPTKRLSHIGPHNAVRTRLPQLVEHWTLDCRVAVSIPGHVYVRSFIFLNT